MPVVSSRGLVIARHRREAVIEDASGASIAALVKGRQLRPLVGDEVLFDREADGTAVIRELCPRKSVLERIDSRGRREGVAANVTLIAVVIAPKPAPDWQLVDRYLVAAALMGIEAAVIRNKLDLPAEDVDGRARGYEETGYPVVATSVHHKPSMQSAAQLLCGHCGVLVGQSGVGKSSIINALLDTDAQTVGELSERKSLGRHTTTAAMLYRLPGGGQIIDSPGVRRYAPSVSNAADLASGFIEFRPFLHHCRFADCRHLGEPGCAIAAAVEAGDIRPERYASFRAMRATIATLRKEWE